MKYEITYSRDFNKSYKRLTTKEQKAVDKKLVILGQNIYHPSLRTHEIRGSNGVMECSVNMDIRLIWRWSGNTAILMMDVGHHDILRRYGVF